MNKDKIELWIEENHVKYLFILVFLGFVFSTGFFYFGGHSKWIAFGFRIGFLISMLFIITDLLIHNRN